MKIDGMLKFSVEILTGALKLTRFKKSLSFSQMHGNPFSDNSGLPDKARN